MAFDLRQLLLAQNSEQGPPMTEEQRALYRRRQEAMDAGVMAPQMMPAEEPPPVMQQAPPPVSPNQEFLQRLNMSNMFNDPDARAREQEAAAQLRELMAAQRNSIQRQEDAAEQIRNQKQGVDLTGLASLADQLAGTKLTPIAQANAPMSPEERAALLSKLEQGVSGDRQAMINVLGSKMAAKDAGRMQMELFKELNKNNRQDLSLDLRKEDSMRNTLDKQLFTPLNDDMQKLAMIDEGLNSGDYQTVGSTMSLFSRVVAGEKGVLTDNDITRNMPSSFVGDAAKAVAYFQNTPTAELPPEYTASLRKMVALAKEKLHKKYSDVVKVKRNVYSSQGSAYRDLMQGGGAGDMMFSEADELLKTFKPTAAAYGVTDAASTQKQAGASDPNDFSNWVKTKGK